MDPKEERLIQRYFRKTPAFPDGAVVHHGDCDVFSIKICNCGFHHDLLTFDRDRQIELHPSFEKELSEYEKARKNRGYKKPAS